MSGADGTNSHRMRDPGHASSNGPEKGLPRTRDDDDNYSQFTMMTMEVAITMMMMRRRRMAVAVMITTIVMLMLMPMMVVVVVVVLLVLVVALALAGALRRWRWRRCHWPWRCWRWRCWCWLLRLLVSIPSSMNLSALAVLGWPACAVRRIFIERIHSLSWAACAAYGWHGCAQAEDTFEFSCHSYRRLMARRCYGASCRSEARRTVRGSHGGYSHPAGLGGSPVCRRWQAWLHLCEKGYIRQRERGSP